jgi:predicted DNA binding CopG/RHH family protein
VAKTAEPGKKGKSTTSVRVAAKRAQAALKPMPAFPSEAAERAFWEANDSTDHVDWTRAKAVRLPNLKPTSKSISLRLPIGLLEALRIEANRRDVPYQSLIKVWLSERVQKKALV